MESWEGYNYYTTDNQKWIQLMNYSTAEWRVGWLPLNVAAIPGPLNNSWQFPPGTTVIENASLPDIGDRGIEKVVFGVTSGVVILWAAWWLGRSIYRGTLFKPLSNHDETDNDADDGRLDHEEFMQTLCNYYYPPIQTELELYEKNPYVEDVAGEDVEAVMELLRRMYDCDLGLYSLQYSPEAQDEERDELRIKSDAILAEVRTIVTSWNHQQEDVQRRAQWWDKEERDRLREIVETMQMIPEKRYDPNYEGQR
jgi:hypothetical protein